MRQLRVMTVFGTRPEAVKMAPVVKKLASLAGQVLLTTVVTGQHREMLDQILRGFEIKPDHDLDIMTHGQTLSQITTRTLIGLEPLLNAHKPDIVLAQGDTTTTFAASLAAFYQRIDFGHVEAGLRSGNRYEPFPEEMNRRLASLCTTLHFAPTKAARDALLAEGVDPASITVTGNTVIDALLEVAASDEPMQDADLVRWVAGRRLILITAHRRENWGQPMRDICAAVRDLTRRFPDAAVVFSMHRNPVVRQVVTEELAEVPQVRLIEPPDYFEFVKLMKMSYIILTDSGGVQEEAPSLAKPVLVLRNTTERAEGVAAGNARLVGTSRSQIVEEAAAVMENNQRWQQMARAGNPYGDGNAAERICQTILEHYQAG